MRGGWLFAAMAALTVASPGPGVVMTLSNAMRFGLRGALGGILGVACGALLVAALSASGLGLLLATSATAFTVAKYVGAAYLLYLGVRLWRAPPLHLRVETARGARFSRRFAEGMALQLTNPKVVVFFLSVFPQFIDPAGDYGSQFIRLELTYGALLVVIHCVYTLSAQRARALLTSARGGRVMNRAAAGAFVGFSAMLALARQ